MRFRTPREAPDRTATGASPIVGDGSEHRRHAGRIAVKLAATAAVLALCGLLASAATWSNLNSTATNPSNSFAAGTVTIGSNSGSCGALGHRRQARPGGDGLHPGHLRRHAARQREAVRHRRRDRSEPVSDDGRHPRDIQRHPAAGSCTGFTADTTNYISQGAGVIYSGTVANWPATAAAAQVDPTAASPESWATGEAHGYEFQFTLANNTAAQGLTGTETFTFEADDS